MGGYYHIYTKQGIIHRGIQPKAILINKDNNFLLTSFDLAILTSSIDHRLLPQQPGSQNYMAPEQFRGSVSQKSDQYALGCIAYELCTGHLPFDEPPFPLTPIDQIKPPIAPHFINPSVTPQVGYAILKSLSFKQKQ
ncbi:protein kinase domain-containing protein [Dictyobacter kobayashii]|uniref:non-specific serine/threonine protein kinase n=1 Tax=Dictyobacter kobayashii TaxID=2014872 RepID=A0A402ACF2_9CHLR|nr:protein kinase [Dictyobacter kobayashii]GCE16773.1 hypothetical protein KDK_05730 [Dictyobacter kobayashii]